MAQLMTIEGSSCVPSENFLVSCGGGVGSISCDGDNLPFIPWIRRFRVASEI